MKRKDNLQLRSAEGHGPVRYIFLLAARIAAAAAGIFILAAACTTDDDPTRPGAAADGPVPFTFIAVAPPAMTDGNTRALGNNKWKGDGTEKIRVRIQVGTDISKSSTGIYTVISPEGKTAVLPGDKPALWPSKDEKYYIYAWYPALKPTLNPGEEYDISDQSTPEKLRQADVVAVQNAGPLPYNATPVLPFRHLMVKVRVVLTGVNASATDIEVDVLGDTKFRMGNNGGVISNTLWPDYIMACRDTEDASIVAFEAMLPTLDGHNASITKQNFIRITIGGRRYYFTPDAAAPKILPRGDAYTYTVAIPSPPTTATASASHITLPSGAPTVIPGTEAVIPSTEAVIPGLTRDLPPRSTAQQTYYIYNV